MAGRSSQRRVRRSRRIVFPIEPGPTPLYGGHDYKEHTKGAPQVPRAPSRRQPKIRLNRSRGGYSESKRREIAEIDLAPERPSCCTGGVRLNGMEG
jgi:hypothetical protein